MYFAIIGDIINSRNINTDSTLQIRNEVQINLSKILEEINIKYADVIAANFLITLGDEFQGLLNHPKYVFEIIETIKLNIYPIKLRFGIGIGSIYTKINRDMAIGADGPAYYNARKMVEQIKVLEKGKMNGSVNIMIKEEVELHPHEINLMNSNLQLCSSIENNWTWKQREIIKEIMLEKKSQVEAAETLGISQSSVQRRLKAAGFYDYIQGVETISTIVSQIWG
ncbi:SatD family protein [Anaerocolumna sp.]|uniref:SatD family protein n=1 Tax=Anaerocolumna sp. TaxID=2041569 RepID=UPI0028AD301C|nr:SatD family protein [Anaerocolumna sp.]